MTISFKAKIRLHYVLAAKVYYHGTASVFDKFTKPGKGKHGIGYYFTPSLSEAKHFAKTLYGAGSGERQPRVITAELTFKKPFNTMSIPDAQKVAAKFGVTYKIPKIVGGPKEHYHALESQLKKAGVVEGPLGKSNFNEKIREAGFDAVEYDFMGHVIVFSPSQIKIKSSEDL